jgi:hypothetical protein
MPFPIEVVKRTFISATLPRLIVAGVWLAIILPQVQAAVIADPPKLRFGDVPVNQQATLPVVLTNTGSSRVTITEDQVRGKSFSSDLTSPVTLKVGQQITIHVTFAPQSEGMHYGKVTASNSNGLLLTIPMNGSGASAGHSVSLSWDPSVSDVVGYNVYRATTSGGPYRKINPEIDPATTYLDLGVYSGRTYYYVTTAVDSGGQESVYSNSVTAVIP